MSIKLQRNIRHRWVGGVCSGLAQFMGLDIFPVRIFLRALCLSFLPITWWIYGLLWIFLPTQRLYEYDEIFLPAPNLDYKEQKRQLKTRYKHDKNAYHQARRELRASLKQKDIPALEFETLLNTIQGRVSDRVYAKSQDIVAATHLLFPRFGWWNTLTNQDLATVKRAAFEYFPHTMQHYLSLPRSYAETHRLASGKTPEEILLADLDVLEHSLNGLVESHYGSTKVPLPDHLKNLSQRFHLYQQPHKDIEGALTVLLERIHGNVDEAIYSKVLSIRTSIVAILPQLQTSMTQQAYDVKQTAFEYLPDALDKYLNLPSGFSKQHQLSNGKNARDTLLEQLELLDTTMKNIVADIYKEDADGLLIHGRFLKEKFADQKFSLPDHRPHKAFPNFGYTSEKQNLKSS